MINHNRKESINEVVSKVFEQTAFLFPEPVDFTSGVSFDDFELILVSIHFAGDMEGNVSLVLPLEMCRELSANILGEEMDENEDKDKNIDAVKEILNIITGQLLTKIFGHKALFNLSAPQVQELNQEEFFSSLANKDFACHIIEQYPVITVFSVEAEHYEHKSIGC
jgi:CheY-specific phosphatase CheX